MITTNSSAAITTATFNGSGQLTTQPTAQEGVNTINSYLSQGQPITVGVNWNGGSQTLNNNVATQHYVTIVGSFSDPQKGMYYQFYDPGTQSAANGTSPNNRLYLNPNDYSLSGTSAVVPASGDSHYYVVTEVRP